MVFLGDGYRQADIDGGAYATHINSAIDHFFHEGENPYPRYEKFFNIHRVDVVSAESGADIPPDGIFKNTALDAKYYFDGVTERLLYINDAKADAAMNAGLLGSGITPNVRMVTVNSNKYGGGGGKYAVYAGGNASAAEVALHETGHSFNRLADEYGGDPGAYAGAEPIEVNVSKDKTGGKWAQWVGYNQPGIGVIGAFEGARYFEKGIYRPSDNSKMRSLGRPFDAVSREKIILDIYDIVDPLDSYTSNAALLVDPAVLTTSVIDPAVIKLQWSVDDALLPFEMGQTLDVAALHLSIGLHSIRVRAYDPTDWVRIHLEKLEQIVDWRVKIVPEPSSWVLIAMACGGLWMARRHRTVET